MDDNFHVQYDCTNLRHVVIKIWSLILLDGVWLSYAANEVMFKQWNNVLVS